MSRAIFGSIPRLAFWLTLALVAGCGDDQGTNGDVPVQKINLFEDDDGDQLADDLEEAIAGVLDAAVSNGDPAEVDSQETEEVTAALDALNQRLPYAKRTRRLQAELSDLFQQVAAAAGDESQLEALSDQIRTKQAALQADPNYQIVMGMVHEMMDKQFPEEVGRQTAQPAGEAADGQGPRYDLLRRGDFLFGLTHDKIFRILMPYVIDFGHAGIFYGSGLVYECNHEGAQLRSIQVWRDDYKRVAMGRSQVRTDAEVSGAIDWAVAKYGNDERTPYNWFVFYPHSKSSDTLLGVEGYQLYCSQLVWKIHDHLDVNVDSNSLKFFSLATLKYAGLYALITGGAGAVYLGSIIFPGVMPDEIFRDDSLAIYSDADNGVYQKVAAPKDIYGIDGNGNKSEGARPLGAFVAEGASIPDGSPLKYLYRFECIRIAEDGEWVVFEPQEAEAISPLCDSFWTPRGTAGLRVTVKAAETRNPWNTSTEFSKIFAITYVPLPPTDIQILLGSGQVVNRITCGETLEFQAIGTIWPVPVHYHYEIEKTDPTRGDWVTHQSGSSTTALKEDGSHELAFRSLFKSNPCPEKVRVSITIWGDLSSTTRTMTREYTVER